MSLGQKTDYLHTGILRPSRLLNLAKNIAFKRFARALYVPRRYSIEPTTACSLKCPYCIHSKYDAAVHFRRESMSYKQFCTVFEKIKPYALLIEFYNFGEPFLNRETPRMIRDTTRAGIRSRISSNLNVPMDEAFARDIVMSGLYRLVCSIDGSRQEIYEKYRVGGKLELAIANAGQIIAQRERAGRKTPKMVFRMLVFEWNHDDVDNARRLAKDTGFDEFYAHPGSFVIDGKSVIWDMEHKRWREKSAKFLEHGIPPKAAAPCEWLFNAMIINANGRALPCCYADRKMAQHKSLLTEALRAIWNSSGYVNSRRYTLGKSDDRTGVLPLCRQCRLL